MRSSAPAAPRSSTRGWRARTWRASGWQAVDYDRDTRFHTRASRARTVLVASIRRGRIDDHRRLDRADMAGAYAARGRRVAGRLPDGLGRHHAGPRDWRRPRD